MQQQYDLEGKVCPNHTSTEAVSRCFTCFKPICELCIKRVDEHDFCSKQCAEAHARTNKSFEEFNELERRQRLRRRIRRTVFMVVSVLVVVFAIRFWVRNPDTVDAWYQVAAEQVGAIKAAISEVIQGFQ